MAFSDLNSHRSWVAYFRIRCFIVCSEKYLLSILFRGALVSDAISAVVVADYDEVFGFPGAQGADELALYSGYVGVENDFGLAAKVFYCVEHEFFVIKDRFVGVEVVQFLPME